MTIPSSIWFSRSSVGETVNGHLASTRKTKRQGIEYVLKSDPPPDAKPIRRCGFTGGREVTPFASIVQCQYYLAQPNEVSVEIDGRCSLATLERIVDWFKRQTIQKTGSNGERYRVFAGDEK